MIQKDIVCKGTNITTNSDQAQPSLSVDDIFADADRQMAEQNNFSSKKFSEKRRKKHPIRRMIIAMLLSLIAVVIIVVVLIVNTIKDVYPVMKANFLSQIGAAQAQLLEMHDDELTVDQYYQKKLFLLFSADDFENVINGVEDFGKLEKLLALEDNVDLDLIPKDKIDEYNQIIAEYQQAMKEAEGTTEETTASVDESGELQTE